MNPDYTGIAVAPLAGAWIEISEMTFLLFCAMVAPLAGAWIEIIQNCLTVLNEKPSLPLRERGLKSAGKKLKNTPTKSLPLRERGLKSPNQYHTWGEVQSLPLRERGLK